MTEVGNVKTPFLKQVLPYTVGNKILLNVHLEVKSQYMQHFLSHTHIGWGQDVQSSNKKRKSLLLRIIKT